MHSQDGYQQQYFVLESFEDAAAKLKAYCKTLHLNIPPDVQRAVGLVQS